MSSATTSERAPARIAGSPPEAALAAADQVALFHRALAELCRSDVPLPRALEAVAEDLGRGPLADAVRAMAADVAEGVPLAEAYAARAESLPRLYRGLVVAGVASGDLPGVLDEIAAHAAAQAEIAAKVRRALAYPAVAATFVAASMTVLVVAVGPRLDAIQSRAALLDGGAVGAWSWTDLLTEPWFLGMTPVALALAVALVLWFAATRRRPLDGATAFAARFWRWPVVGRIRMYTQVATISATLSLLLRRRVPLAQALQCAAEACDEPGLRARVAAMADAADAGASLGDTLAEHRIFAPSLVWIVDSAERRGDAAGALADVAAIYRERLSRTVDRATLWITPVAEAMVGIVVGVVALAYTGRLLAVTEILRALAVRS